MKIAQAFSQLAIVSLTLSLSTVLLCQSTFGQTNGAEATAAKPETAATAKPNGVPKELEAVLTAMDNAAANFKSAQAELEWDQYSLAANDKDVQTGTIYFRKQKHDIEMAAHFVKPKKVVVFTGGNFRLYEPGLDQITEYVVSKDRGEVESFLNIGFGGRGHDLLNSFEVTYGGSEIIDGVKTEKLELVPKSSKVKKNLFEKIVLWIDPSKSVSLKQQFSEPSGDYRIAYYRNIRYGSEISKEVFKLPTTSRTKIVHPE